MQNTYTRISGTAAGTSLVVNRSQVLEGVFIGQNKTGTVSLYDSATTAGTSSTNFLGDIQNTCGSVPVGPKIGASLHNGLVAVTGGTTDMLLIWG